MPSHNLELQAQKKVFYSKKKIIIISLSFILAVALIILSFTTLIKVNFNELFNQFVYAFATPTHIGWFAVLVVYVFLSFFFNVITFWIRIRKMNIHIPVSQWILLALTIGFLKAVTPANFVYDPYTLFWMRSNGISVGRASAIIFINAWEWQVVQLLITIPSFIIVMQNIHKVFELDNGNIAFTFLILGLVVDVIGCLLMTFLCFSTRIHVFLSSMFNWVKKKLHIPYHTKEQIKEAYQEKALIQKEYINSMKQYKDTILIFTLIFFNEFIIYSMVFTSFSFIRPSDTLISFWPIFNATNVVFTANKLIITPGGEFSIEFMMDTFLRASSKLTLTDDYKKFISHGILIWRLFIIYFPCLFGFFCFSATLISHFKKNKNSIKKEAIFVGCGISSATLAHQLAQKGYQIIIYEKNSFIGGNCYDYWDRHNVLVHKYGPHIFHTSDAEVYEFFCKFTKLNHFVNKVLVKVNDLCFPLPINFTSIKIICPKNASYIINFLKNSFKNQKTVSLYDIKKINDKKIKSFVDYILKNVFFNYTAKMWGIPFEKIDPSTINRVQIVLSYEHNYFPNDKWQGLPEDGYTEAIRRMVKHPNIKLMLNTNCFKKLKFDFDKKVILHNKQVFNGPVFYCGPLDKALNYKFGQLPYRSLNIEFESIKKPSYQETAVINYPGHKTMTRITEYKHMTLNKNNNPNWTTISKEYPSQFDEKSDKFNNRYYPIQSQKNQALYTKYLNVFKQFKNFYPLGRLAQYRYYDMDDAIKHALMFAKEF